MLWVFMVNLSICMMRYQNLVSLAVSSMQALTAAGSCCAAIAIMFSVIQRDLSCMVMSYMYVSRSLWMNSGPGSEVLSCEKY